MSDSSRPHGLQPTRLLRPWDFPGKSTGVGAIRAHLIWTSHISSAEWLHVSTGHYVYGNQLSQFAQDSPDFSSDGPLPWETPGSLANLDG